jgi:hypothetical protein
MLPPPITAILVMGRAYGGTDAGRLGRAPDGPPARRFASPTRVQEECEVDLPFPRDQVTTKELAEFTRLRGHVYRSIRGERTSAAATPAGAAAAR